MGHWGFWASDTGVLSYSPGREFSYLPTWFDRSGQILDSVGDPAFDCFDQSLSPDEKFVALTCYDPQLGASDIRLVDLERNVSSRLTSDPDWDQWPVWSPDSKRLAFWSMTELRERVLDEMGEHKVLMRLEHFPLKPMDWSPDGKFILYQTHERGIHSDLMFVPTTGSGQPESYLATRFSEMEGRFSPDGKWVAYASDESGRFEVYVRSFPDGNQRYQISNDGGRRPFWRGDGKEIFYIDADNYVIAALIEMTPTFKIGSAKKLFETAFPIPDESRYSVSPDGQRFLLYSPTGRATMTIVLNWTAELEK
jgi:Tol biopolymer transport system component